MHPDVNHLGTDASLNPCGRDQRHATAATSLPIGGIATDDSHEYHETRLTARRDGSWSARHLTPEHLIRAMKAGDFYASSGVVLHDVNYDSNNRTLSISIEPVAGVEYETQFIAVRKPADLKLAAADEWTQLSEADLPAAEVVSKATGHSVRYQLSGDELYVRAVVSSNRPPADPVFDGQVEQAWTQPVAWEISH